MQFEDVSRDFCKCSKCAKIIRKNRKENHNCVAFSTIVERNQERKHIKYNNKTVNKFADMVYKTNID